MEYFKENDTYIFWGESNTDGWVSHRINEDFDNDRLHDGIERWFGSSAWISDFDKDGLDDSEEFRYNKWSYGEKNGADPNKKDIFVEVDWMEGYVRDFQYVKEIGGGGYYKEIKRLITHKMSTEDKNNVIEIFKNHKIRFHIDGGSMGEGGPITLINKINEDQRREYAEGNGGPKGNEGFTNRDRYGTFFYFLIVHDTSEDLFYKEQEAIGSGWWATLFDDKRFGGYGQIWFFTHELGHGFIDDIDDKGSNAHKSKHPTYGDRHCNQKDCVMYCKSSGENLRSDPEDWNYCSYCWTEITRGDFADSLPVS